MNYRLITRFLALLLVTCLILPATARVIDQATAEKAARNFLFEKLSQKNTVAYKDVVVSSTYTVNDNGMPVYYGINFRDGGFVIITADDIVKPIIGYSTDGFFKMTDQPESLKNWMAGIKEQVTSSRSKALQSSSQTTAQWARLTDDSFSQKSAEKSSKTVAPLVMSHWNQNKYFNTMCPVDPAGPEGRALTGCVATAMAQVIYYYRYPATGVGTHTYGTNGNPAPFGHYGTLSVNYNNATYNYDGMVNDLSETNMEVAKLIYNCGVAVSMEYGPTGSASQTQNCVGAMISHFRYSSTTSYVMRSNFSNTDWHAILQTEIDAKRPVLYSGNNPAVQEGHLFIADGYQISSSDTLYHFNWGWGGSSDGYFSIDDLNPDNQGPFNASQAIVKGIYPANSFPAQCTGPKVITSSQGTIEDGSSYTANYSDNADCSWLLAPTDSVSKFILTFERFSTESINDYVKVYDGADTNAPLLLTHSGSSLPAGPVTSTGNRMLITFHTNGSINDEGWLATYKPNYPIYCSGTTLTAPFGTVSDGSGTDHNYNNNSNCNWIIQPPNPDNKTLILEFTSFNTEATYDYVKVYDLASQTQLGPTFSGNALPPVLVSPSGQIYIEFNTNYAYPSSGWSANYSLGFIGIGEVNGFGEMKIYPNPANDHLNISFNLDAATSLSVDLLSLTGQSVIKENYSNFSGIYNKSLDLSSIARGIYTLRLTCDKGVHTQKVVIQ